MPDNSIDSIVTDPPYELGFMGKKWDSTGIAYDATLWAECLRVLKPGGHLIAFGGTRTYHRMTCAIEDAGFEIRDCIQWIYGSGFPKSHNLDGDWHGFGTALKPAVEPAVLARKPLSGTVADNVMTWGVGALNIDGCRVPSDDGFEKAWDKPVRTNIANGGGAFGTGESSKRGTKAIDISANKPVGGRWPANVIFDEEAAQMLDEQSGHSVSKATPRNNGQFKSFSKGFDYAHTTHGHSDSGGASRFFYVAKASRAEREAGLDGDSERANHHPTVKPITLMRYLIRLVTPPGGTVLDPFMGSGSTGCAAMLEAMQFIGIELNAEYLEIARRRIEFNEYTVREKNPMGL
jgi:site-specific DNA-methyltransferase (adenine-specific)